MVGDSEELLEQVLWIAVYSYNAYKGYPDHIDCGL